MLSERVKALLGSQTSGMRNRARKLKAEGVSVVNFAAGELDQDTSPDIKAAARQAIESAGGRVEILPPPFGRGRPPAKGNALTNR